jgi:thioredoxin 1
MGSKSPSAAGIVLLTVLFAGCQPAEEPAGQPGAEPVELTDANFQQLVLDSKQPVLVDVYATWCGPCRKMAPAVGELAAEFKGRAVVGKLDSDRQQGVCRRYDVRYLPTFLFFKNGSRADQVVGPTSKEDLAQRLGALVGP